MNKIKVKRYIGGALIAIIFGVIFYSNQKIRDEKYITIDKNTEFLGFVKNHFIDRGSLYIDLGHSYYQMITTRNKELRPSYVADFMRNGDIVKKKKNSYYMVICRDGKGYYFHIKQSVHRKRIGECFSK